MSTTPTSSGSRAKDPAIVQESRKPIEFVGCVLSIILAILVISCMVVWANGCREKTKQETEAKKAKAADEVARPTSSSPQPSVEGLVLMHECITPCSADIRYKAKIRTDGDPLRIKFQGVSEWFNHDGKGPKGGPPGVQVGETKFVSADENNPHVKVWVYKKVLIGGN